jgi:PAS domain S-box-containing protein
MTLTELKEFSLTHSPEETLNEIENSDVDEIPMDFFKDLVEDSSQPFACVNLDNEFVWINSAFEELVGYSKIELIKKTWMELTKRDEVGDDLASVGAVKDGDIDSYRMSKNYIHKNGYEVPVVLIVKRWPKTKIHPLLYFRVEAFPPRASRTELKQLQTIMDAAILTLQKEIDEAEASIQEVDKKASERISIGNVMGAKHAENSSNIGTGNSSTVNDTTIFKYLTAAIIALAGAVMWLGYYVATMDVDSVPEPPSIENPLGKE